jgi:hypothetical protein
MRVQGAATATSGEAENLSDALYVCEGARVILTIKNLWMVNGSMGTVGDIFWSGRAQILHYNDQDRRPLDLVGMIIVSSGVISGRSGRSGRGCCHVPRDDSLAEKTEGGYLG